MINYIDYQEVLEKIHYYQNNFTDCFFIINYDKTQGFCLPIDQLDSNHIKYSINQNNNVAKKGLSYRFKPEPISLDQYHKSYKIAQQALKNGSTYLINLTASNKIITDLNLETIFHYSKARYKLWIQNQFVVFSPESFVRVENNRITTHPMKGTKLELNSKSEYELYHNSKEDAEHYTIIDLLRNDLSLVATNVKVDHFKKIERISTNFGVLLQMSSDISGQLREEYRTDYGKMLDLLLPAGSITGAPKKKTVQIIQSAEMHNRNFYTGVFGHIKSGILESAVMIRFIELTENGFVFKSGGGITADSDPNLEYDEMVKKIYVPFL